jgi:hypothetical protein
MAMVEWSTAMSVIANDIQVPSGFKAEEFIVNDVLSREVGEKCFYSKPIPYSMVHKVLGHWSGVGIIEEWR